MCCIVLRPYHAECTGSRLITEVKVPLTCKIFILLNEAVLRVKTDGDTKSHYTYVQIGKNPQLPVAVPLKVSHFCDDVTRGTVRRITYCLTYCKCEF